MTHLTEISRAIVGRLNREGFGGIRCDARVEAGCTREEVVPSEITDPQYDDRLRDMAYFIVEPCFDAIPVPDSKYLIVELNVPGFWNDLRHHIQSQVGSDVTVNLRRGCHEFELLREAESSAAGPSPFASPGPGIILSKGGGE